MEVTFTGILIICGMVFVIAVLIILAYHGDKLKGLKIGSGDHMLEFGTGIDRTNYCLSILADWMETVLIDNGLCNMEEDDFNRHCDYRILELMPQLDLAVKGQEELKEHIRIEVKESLVSVRSLHRYWRDKYYDRMNEIKCRLAEEVTALAVEQMLDEHKKLGIRVYRAQYKLVLPRLKAIAEEVKAAME